MQPSKSKVSAVQEFPVPCNQRAVKSFLYLSGYYRRHIQNFATIAEPLIRLTKQDQPYVWGPLQVVAFETLNNL